MRYCKALHIVDNSPEPQFKNQVQEKTEQRSKATISAPEGGFDRVALLSQLRAGFLSLIHNLLEALCLTTTEDSAAKHLGNLQMTQNSLKWQGFLPSSYFLLPSVDIGGGGRTVMGDLLRLGTPFQFHETQNRLARSQGLHSLCAGPLPLSPVSQPWLHSKVVSGFGFPFTP